MTIHAPKAPFHSISDYLKLKIYIQKLGINICFYKSTQQILALSAILLYQADTLFIHLLWYPLYSHLSLLKHCWRFEYVEAFVVAVLHLPGCGKILPLSQRWHLLHNHLIAMALIHLPLPDLVLSVPQIIDWLVRSHIDFSSGTSVKLYQPCFIFKVMFSCGSWTPQ